MSITPPNTSPKRELARVLFDATLSGVPLIGGHMAALYSVTHPAKNEVDEANWREEISKLVNSIEKTVEFISGSISLSEDAASLGKWMSESSEDGWSGIFRYEEFVAQFPDASNNELLEALGELELERMINISNCFGKPFSHVRATHRLFETFDPIVFPEISPRSDAAIVANKLLDSENGISAQKISEEQEWSIRRINPALAIVGEFIAEGRKSQEMGQPYAINFMFVDGQERAILRRFVNQVAGK